MYLKVLHYLNKAIALSAPFFGLPQEYLLKICLYLYMSAAGAIFIRPL
jgi:hypothetical protein